MRKYQKLLMSKCNVWKCAEQNLKTWFKCFLLLLFFCFQDVSVHLPDWPGGSHSVRNVPGSGLKDGQPFNNFQKISPYFVVLYVWYLRIETTVLAVTIIYFWDGNMIRAVVLPYSLKKSSSKSLALWTIYRDMRSVYSVFRRGGLQWRSRRALATWKMWTSAGSPRRPSTPWVWVCCVLVTRILRACYRRY